MENAIEQINLLIKQGQEFTYDNFSAKTHNGYPNSFSPEWAAWEARAKSIVVKLFGEGSAQDKALAASMSVSVLRNGPDKFEQRKKYVIATLQTAIDTLNNDVFGELSSKKATAPMQLSNKVFIVHGQDEAAKTSLEVFLSEIGLEPVVLHRQPDEGQTIIEKFEKHSNVGYVFILLTPDEVAFLRKDLELPEPDRKIEYRARPNVIFEFGYFVGKLGRARVCCLHTGDVSLPTDVSGIVYKSYASNIEEVAFSIIKDLKACGYKLALT